MALLEPRNALLMTWLLGADEQYESDEEGCDRQRRDAFELSSGIEDRPCNRCANGGSGVHGDVGQR